MDENFDDAFNNHSNASENEETVEQTQLQEPEQAAEIAEEATETAPETVEVREPEAKPPVPLAAVEAERHRRQEAERRAADFERQLAQLQAEKSKDNRPDPFENPDDFHTYVEQLAEQKAQHAINLREQQSQMAKFQTSYEAAVAKVNSTEVVDGAVAWATQVANTNRQFADALFTQPDPVAWMLEQQNRSALIEEIARDPDGYVARQIAARTANAVTSNDAAASQITHEVAANVTAPRSVNSLGTGAAAKPSARSRTEDFNRAFDDKRR